MAGLHRHDGVGVGLGCGVVWLLVLQLHTSLPVCFSIINRRLLTELKHALSIENVFILVNKGRNNQRFT